MGGIQEFTGVEEMEYKIQSEELPATIFNYELGKMGKQNQMQQSLDAAVACTASRMCRVN